jgi:hypothetical protein
MLDLYTCQTATNKKSHSSKQQAMNQKHATYHAKVRSEPYDKKRVSIIQYPHTLKQLRLFQFIPWMEDQQPEHYLTSN